MFELDSSSGKSTSCEHDHVYECDMYMLFWACIYNVCSTILVKNTPPSEFLPDSNTEYTSGDTRIFSQLHPPLLINEHKHPFGKTDPQIPIVFKNSILQLIFSIFRNDSDTSPYNSSTEGTLLKCLFFIQHIMLAILKMWMHLHFN